MRTLEEMKDEFNLLGKVMEKYNHISKLPFDFGVGMPLYPSEIHTIATLCNQGSMSITELAETTGVTKGAISQLVTKLEKKKLVRKTPAPDNLSKSIITPTELGKKAQEGHMNFHKTHDEKFINAIASLSDAEYAVFRKLCRQMNSWMNTYLE